MKGKIIYASAIDSLLKSNEPSIRYKTLVHVLNENPESPKIKRLQSEIKNSERVKKLLSRQDEKGRIISKRGVYDKWQGAHWILATLADIGYPENDKTLYPVKDQVLDTWLNPIFYTDFEVDKKRDAYKKEGVVFMQGRARRCASQQGYALYYLLKLGLQDPRIPNLTERLLYWQWPDGGWNCDKNPTASHSSFIHTVIALKGLALYSKKYKDSKAEVSCKKAAEVLLRRNLYKRETTGQIINPEFIQLHYPLYWHYDLLGGLKIMAEAGFIKDPRCNDPLDLLESKMLPSGGWPAEKTYYKVSDEIALGNDYVDWGGTSRKKINEWITVDALYVLKSSGRFE